MNIYNPLFNKKYKIQAEVRRQYLIMPSWASKLSRGVTYNILKWAGVIFCSSDDCFQGNPIFLDGDILVRANKASAV